MKKVLLTAFLVIGLQGCALHSVIPSFWDDNQAVAVIDARQAVEQLDCSKPHAPQVKVIKDRLDWFDLYSESKGMMQNDVRALVGPMRKTVDDFYKRSVEKEGSEAYCNAKKKVMKVQASKAAEGILGRF
jgi:hypothetical protein